MTSDLQRPHRRSIRLPGYDYTLAGAYFVTVVVQQRACLLGTIENNVMHLSPAGEMVRAAWESLPARFPHVAPDAFVVMPNHVHGVIFMMDDIWVAAEHGSEPRAPGPDVGAPLVGAQGVDAGDASIEPRATTRVAPTGGVPITPGATTRVAPTGRAALGDVVGAWKSLTTVAYITGVKQAGWLPFCSRLWQRNYYEHIVRDDEDLASIRRYILANPRNWAQDAEYSL